MAKTATIPDGSPSPRAAADAVCFHCGEGCRTSRWHAGEKVFCCQGCLTVFELLTENGLAEFYELAERAGVKAGEGRPEGRFAFVDAPGVREKLVDFTNERWTRVTLRLPAIHCVACVWLLESLFRLRSGIGESRVQFSRKELSILFATAEVKLSDVLELLTVLGYEPDLKLSDLAGQGGRGLTRRLWLQLGVAGFAFGNTMLLSVASYFGWDSVSGPGLQKMLGWISLLLALPVVTFSAADYWRSAWRSIRRRVLSIDVPIALGILAFFVESCPEVLSGRGLGYFDSLTGLVFFLLCGRLFQEKTFDRLAFDRGYQSFFPLSVTRRQEGKEESVCLSELGVGDRLFIRNGELIPADAVLVSGQGLVDYSFVTGESAPVHRQPGDYLYAGGRQIGTALEVETAKSVSQGYLTSLWNQEAFQKPDEDQSLHNLLNRYSRRFTKAILGLALASGIFWARSEVALGFRAFTSVLIVACPCALALAAPFALGTAQRLLARRKVYLKNPAVIEHLAAAQTVVLDKTGTLTHGRDEVVFNGPALTTQERQWCAALVRHSTHPLATQIGRALQAVDASLPVHSFQEALGQGLTGQVAGHQIRLGSAAWIKEHAVEGTTADGDYASQAAARPGNTVHLAIDGFYRGHFVVASAVRPGMDRLVSALSRRYRLALLSGDTEREKPRFEDLFRGAGTLLFNQSPLDKLGFIQRLQAAGQSVIMVGDGLNDAGALKQSDVGMAVVEEMSAFSPASDVILAGSMVPSLDAILTFSQRAVRVVKLSLLVSTVYNVVGVTLAVRGLLSPVVCAILMPTSSVTVVTLACLATTWFGRRLLPTSGQAAGAGQNPGAASVNPTADPRPLLEKLAVAPTGTAGGTP